MKSEAYSASSDPLANLKVTSSLTNPARMGELPTLTPPHSNAQVREELNTASLPISLHASSSVSRKKGKPRKPPGAPKNPRSAYTLYMKCIRDEVAHSHPKANFADIGRIVGELWRTMPPETKQIYEDMATQDRKRFEIEMETFVKSNMSETTYRKRCKKDPDAPKRPRSAYTFFMSSVRPSVCEENPKCDFGQIGRIVGAKWRDMSNEEKRPYERMAERDRLRNSEELLTYFQGHDETGEEGVFSPGSLPNSPYYKWSHIPDEPTSATFPHSKDVVVDSPIGRPHSTPPFTIYNRRNKEKHYHKNDEESHSSTDKNSSVARKRPSDVDVCSISFLLN